VLAEHDVGLRVGIQHAVGDHRLCARAVLLGRLEHGDDGARPLVLRRDERSSAPSIAVTCMSWPQACMTGTSVPAGSMPRAVEA
jgi:hypothetical protein